MVRTLIRSATTTVATSLLLATATPAIEPSSHHFTASDGTRIHWLEAGSGAPVLLIHGYTGSARGNWFANGVAERLADTHRVIAIDVRGHGSSEKPHDSSAYGPRIWRDALELLDHLGVERSHVHGYSMGGSITTQLLRVAPERFWTASYGGAGVRETDPARVAELPEEPDGPDPEETQARSQLSASPDRDEKALGLVRETWRDAFGIDLDLTTLDLPILAINGEFDRPIARTRRLQREARHFRSVVLPGKSHLTAIMADYIPRAYADELHAFLQAHTPIVDRPAVREAAAALDVWTDAQLDYQQIPGAAMAVIADQEVVFDGVWGRADREAELAVRNDTQFSICSISKLFTSIAALQLRDAGKLELDRPIDAILERYELGRPAAGSPPVTTRSLLTHSSGLPRESDHPYWDGPDFSFPSADDVYERLPTQEALYPAQRHFQYSNLGLTLAGEVVAAASGRPYADYVTEQILEPLGMLDTRPDIPAMGQDADQFATGYGRLQRDGSRPAVLRFRADGIAPAAGFASTSADLARFVAWQHRALETGHSEVLAGNTLREMQRVHWLESDWSTSWGLGFGVRRIGDRTYVGHGGSCPGFRSEVLVDPARRIGVVFVSNAMGVDTRNFVRAAQELFGPVVEKERGRAAPADPAGDSSALEPYLGRYASAWGEEAVISWDGELATISLSGTGRPMNTLTRTLPTDRAHVFRRRRQDGSAGEPWRFEVDASGRVTRLIQHRAAAERID